MNKGTAAKDSVQSFAPGYWIWGAIIVRWERLVGYLDSEPVRGAAISFEKTGSPLETRTDAPPSRLTILTRRGTRPALI
jgi:hypothetical protein